MHLKNVYSDSYFNNGEEGYPDYFKEREILVEHGSWYAHIINKFMKPGKMFDVGAAAGFIMLGFQQNGWECAGLEPNQNMVDFGRNTLKLNLKCGFIESYSSDEKYDLVTLIQVIGHFFNVELALENISNILKNDGLLLVECWDQGSLAARILGKNWHEYSPPSVINWFTKNNLTQKLKEFGFGLIKIGRPKKQISCQHAMSLIIYKYRFLRALCAPINKSLKGKDFFITYPPIDIFYAIYKKGISDGAMSS
jgi:SAM-dependent methyltransferase